MRLRINQPTVIHETIDGETIVIHMTSGTYYSLVDAGATVWNLIGQHATVEEIVDALAHDHDASREAIRVAVGRLVDELRQEDLVVADPGPTAEGPARAAAAIISSVRGQRPLPSMRLEKFTDMQDLVRLDPVHEVGEAGWPRQRSALDLVSD